MWSSNMDSILPKIVDVLSEEPDKAIFRLLWHSIDTILHALSCCIWFMNCCDFLSKFRTLILKKFRRFQTKHFVMWTEIENIFAPNVEMF